MNPARALLPPVLTPLVTGDALADAVFRHAVVPGYPGFGADDLGHVGVFGATLAASGVAATRFCGNDQLDDYVVTALFPADDLPLWNDHGLRVGEGWDVFGPAQVGPAQVGPAQVGIAQVGPAQVGPAQVGPAQVGPAQVGLAQVGLAQVGPAQVGPAQVGPAQVGPAQVGPAQVGPAQVGPAQVPGPPSWPPISRPSRS